MPWVVEQSGKNKSIASHLEKCHEKAERSNEPFLGVCPSEGFYFTIVCLGKMNKFYMTKCITEIEHTFFGTKISNFRLGAYYCNKLRLFKSFQVWSTSWLVFS